VADVVVTVPKKLWSMWLEEGDLAGEPWSQSAEYHFWLRRDALPTILPGERVYVVAHGRLRGYAPLVRTELRCRLAPSRACLVRRNDAVAVTIPDPIVGFQGWRYRWWDRSAEVPFPEWRSPDPDEALERLAQLAMHGGPADVPEVDDLFASLGERRGMR
jgi:hypothetical protein